VCVCVCLCTFCALGFTIFFLKNILHFIVILLVGGHVGPKKTHAAFSRPFLFFSIFFLLHGVYSHDRIVKSLDKLVEKQKMTMEFANTTLGRIEFTTDMDALRETDLIVEAIIENMSLKEDLYTKLGELCQPETIFASNTSSLSIIEMAAFSGRPDKFVGVHFFNPVQVRYEPEKCYCQSVGHHKNLPILTRTRPKKHTFTYRYLFVLVDILFA
jgi:hypothetical protein